MVICHSSSVKISKIMYNWSPKQTFDVIRMITTTKILGNVSILSLLETLIITSLGVYLILEILLQ